jgi:uncharacterized surface protein with fasciclin (FAS1) repeats
MLNLLATSIGAGSFRAFVTAISRAKLGRLLSGPGPFTVFVPTDAAFAQATGGGMWSLTGDLTTLTRVLACHIVPGRWTAAAMVKQHSLRTLRGERVDVELDGGIRVGGAHVLKPNLLAANGVIHIIDGVILPPELPWLGDHAEPVVIARPPNSPRAIVLGRNVD